MNELFEIRYNDGIINSHSEVIRQVKLLQSCLVANKCFSDLPIDGRYGKTTRKAVQLIKQRFKLPINDRIDKYTWACLLQKEVQKVIITPKSNDLEIPKEALELLGIPADSIAFQLSKLIAIPCFKSFSQSQITALLLFAFRTNYDYGLSKFQSINQIFERNLNINDSFPRILSSQINYQNQNQVLQEISFWKLDKIKSDKL
jgi:peptidoglycan hydrolase-like protein with peptidoglycan-binding domain